MLNQTKKIVYRQENWIAICITPRWQIINSASYNFVVVAGTIIKAPG